MKNLLFSLEEIYHDSARNIITSLSNVDLKNLWKQK